MNIDMNEEEEQAEEEESKGSGAGAQAQGVAASEEFNAQNVYRVNQDGNDAND